MDKKKLDASSYRKSAKDSNAVIKFMNNVFTSLDNNKTVTGEFDLTGGGVHCGYIFVKTSSNYGSGILFDYYYTEFIAIVVINSTVYTAYYI